MRDENCIFCKIVAGEIPSRTLFEDEDFKVILDVGPAAKGHALIVPKAHYADIYELPGELAGEAMKLAKRMATHMTTVLNCDGFNILQNNGVAAGQTVFHYHMHLIPRYKDGEEMILWKENHFSDEEMDALAQQLKVQ